MTDSTTSQEFFDKKYRDDADPWNFARSHYEQSRYRAILAALGDRRYDRAFEPGCSVGELTRQLAAQCAHVDAMDISPTAIEIAKVRCQDFSNISFHVGGLAHHNFENAYDLMVFSEIGYYFEEPVLRELGARLVRSLRTSGTLLAVHWLGKSKDHVLSGDRVHEILGQLSGLKNECAELHTGFRLDRWVRV